MYDLYVISTGDLAAVIAAVATVGLLLGGLLGRILDYLLRIESRIATIEEAIKTLQGK